MFKKLRVLLYVFILLLATVIGIGQGNQSDDSLLISLKSIRSISDSGSVPNVFSSIEQANSGNLVNEAIWKEMNAVKKFISNRDYNDLCLSYVSKLVSLNTLESNERALELGEEYVKKIQQAKTDYDYFTAIWIFREVRSAFRNLGKLNESLKFYGEAERVFQSSNDSVAISIANNVLSGSYFRLGMMERAIYHQGKSIAYLNHQQLNLNDHIAHTLVGLPGKLNRYAVLAAYYLSDHKLTEADSCLEIATSYYQQLDSPLLHQDVPYIFLQRAINKALSGDGDSQLAFDTCHYYMLLYKLSPHALAVFFQEKAIDLIRLEKLDSATFYLNRVHQYVDSFNLGIINSWGQITPAFYEARIAMKKGDYDRAIYLLKVQISKLEPLNLRTNLIQIYELLAEANFSKGNSREAYQAMRQAFSIKEKVVQDEKEARTLSFETERKIQENETAIMLLNAKDQGNKKTRLYLFGIIALLGMLALVMTFFYRIKQKGSVELASKNLKLEQALAELKSTQAQLIQSEKMASLGELTAGIAHEIQNPLNFVNNFSEVSSELISELVEEVDKGNTDEVKLIAKDVQQNIVKINHHGKRADAIVKGMIAHSRVGTGKKELTDLNALAEEYLRLAYAGMQAKDKNFKATYKFEPDPNLPKLEVVPQDIGRVLINLINNAFYAVTEKSLKGIDGYEPTVILKTQKPPSGGWGVTISDNGPGIPDSIKDKIFQPFFTTKPTGQGTGLGLSLSYDIVKAHGGKITVKSQPEGANLTPGTEFIITLPVA